MSDSESITQDELAAALKHLGYPHAVSSSQQLFDDVKVHRGAGVYEVGEIYQDAKDRRFLRVRNPEWPWCLVGFRRGDDESVRGNFASTHLEDFPERPLRKLVPQVRDSADYDNGYTAGFTAGQEASDA